MVLRAQLCHLHATGPTESPSQVQSDEAGLRPSQKQAQVAELVLGSLMAAWVRHAQ